ncbi:hypothetical protein ACH41H_24735 [Streptomyces sp. NPDC020800]|uniref:hypothetical protein n=1 Tax=Streptomyces sp. NPDC020800 TaxID=3365092 RepID=UPI0037971AB6
MAVLTEVLLAAAPAGVAVSGTAAWYYRRSALRSGAALQRLRQQYEGLAGEVKVRDQEAGHLAAVRMPALVASPTGDPTQAGPLLHPHLAETPFGRAIQAALRQSAGFVSDAKARTEAAAHAQLQAILAPLAAQAAQQQSAMVQLLGHVADERVLGHGFAVDHGVTLLVQRMQIIGVLAGQEVGTRRPDTPLMTVVGGAASRVHDYQRVKITTGNGQHGIRGPVAEPIAVALAELMENGARHSAPGSPVSVWCEPVQGGVNVLVNSVGPMRDPADYERAAAVLSGTHPIPFTALGPRLGLAAVGALARRVGVQVWLEPQADRVRAFLHVPARLLCVAPAPAEPQQHGHTPDATGARTDSARRMAAFRDGARAANQASLPEGHGAAPFAGGAPLAAREIGERR